jgi:hypothetical protein
MSDEIVSGEIEGIESFESSLGNNSGKLATTAHPKTPVGAFTFPLTS